MKAFFFDLDDTLFDEADFIRSGFEAVAAYLKAPAFASLAWEVHLSGFRGSVFDETLRRLGQKTSPTLVKSLVDCYRSHKPLALNLKPDADAILSFLKEHDFTTGIITDGFLTGQKHKVEALGLQNRVDRIYFTDSFGRALWKPHPHCFELAMKELSLNASGCVYVGDNPAKDFVAPNQLGWHSIRVIRPRGIHEAAETVPNGTPRSTIRSLTELEEFL